ncbi:MAG: LytTR family transcriptional regulator, partial [Octadecabacter sp.]
DGLARNSRAALLAALESHGTVTAFESPRPVLGLRAAQFEDDNVTVTALRATSGVEVETTITAIGLDPAGVERRLSSAIATFEATATQATATFDLPPELRNRVTRFEIQGMRSAGAVTLTDDALKRREVALLAGASDREALDLLSPLHYLEQALIPTADLIDGTLQDVLLANPDAIILADVGTLTAIEADTMLDWVESGGLLVRFAGPRLAASDISRIDEDPLMPVRLRIGGRSIGGAMSWGEPKVLAPFPASSPFFGLTIPDDVAVTAQVVAQPDPTLAQRVIAQLADGTPLVTRKSAGSGSIVLFHVTANAEWSTLPLSGLFVQMLERLAVSTRPSAPTAEDLIGTTWMAEDVLDAFGDLTRADTLPGVD